ncbi:Putative Flagellin, Flp1-like, domain [Gracilibacillus orientalis]|uniref:Putative Flagellin, Flp1-like, domain n=1 Tax=Gracilibacillus orientalis TaxID=334253 RepID=A0A1I4P5Y6_9BACI|nr:Flp1 family type IVb pilin [Gracilibacillus orientalis]SFM23026.1 Putative Flagellin, Flp1-like, domain [Gracilibacillus orientalis]
MKGFLTNLWTEEDGMGTLELLLIVAVLVAVAILFGNQIITWVEEVIDGISVTPPTTDN